MAYLYFCVKICSLKFGKRSCFTWELCTVHVQERYKFDCMREQYNEFMVLPTCEHASFTPSCLRALEIQTTELSNPNKFHYWVNFLVDFIVILLQLQDKITFIKLKIRIFLYAMSYAQFLYFDVPFLSTKY